MAFNGIIKMLTNIQEKPESFLNLVPFKGRPTNEATLRRKYIGSTRSSL